ncbi:MAG: nucleotidyltransferase family protein, partial [Clostridia bacterium]|nr:nucleotidyltransferase family protein [Clostridia bacterium]
MKTVAVTTEFNPFHNGHQYLAEKIREKYGLDTAVVAVMSGCYVQRGEVAIADPYFRAKTALLGGYDLILELPFPFCVSGAETFTRAAVELISSLHSVDAIAFGSECGDLSALLKAADLLADEKTGERIKQERQIGEGKRKGMP